MKQSRNENHGRTMIEVTTIPRKRPDGGPPKSMTRFVRAPRPKKRLLDTDGLGAPTSFERKRR